MVFPPSVNDERGASEIYGTFLIISIVVLMALVVVGVGLLAFNNITDEADDDLVRQSMLEFDDRVSELTSEDVSQTATMRFPEGTADEIEAQPEHGTVNISVETHSAYWEVTNPDGDLLNDTSVQQNHTEITLGSLVYENDGGTVTAYQGGAVWKKQGDNVKVLSAPDLYVDDETLQLSFIDISSVELVQEGQDVVLQKSPEQSADRSQSIMQVVEQQMQSHYPDGRLVANATVSMNITSEFAAGWAKYARSNLDAKTVNLYEASDVAGDSPKVEIVLGTYGEGLLNAANRDYADGIVYSGFSEFAQDLYDNGSADPGFNFGNITDDDPGRYTVEAPNGTGANKDATVGILYDNESRGNGPEWWVWNGTDWTNAEDPHADPLNSPEIPDPTVGPNSKTFELPADTWSCVAATEKGNNATQFREFIPNATEYQDSSVSDGCLEKPVGINVSKNWQSYVGQFKTDFVIKDFDVTVENGAGIEQPGFDPKNEKLEPGYFINVTVKVENVGYRNATANEIPVGVLYDQNATSKKRLGDDPRIINGSRLGTDIGETFKLTHEFEVQDANDQYFLGVGAGTPHDADGFEDNYTVDVNTKSEFNVTITDNEVGGPTVREGDMVSVTLNVTNEGPVEDNQTVFIWGENENEEVLTTKEFSLDPNEYQVETLTWTTEVGRESDWSKVTASAPLSNTPQRIDDETLTVKDPNNGPEFDVTITGTNATAPTDNVTEGEPLTVDIEVENTGDAPGTPTAVLYNSTAGVDEPVNGTEGPEIDDGDTWTTTLTWHTFVNDSTGDTHVKVNVSNDDIAEKNVTIEPREPRREPVDVVFALDETGSMGEYRDDYSWLEVVDSKTLTSSWEVPEGDELWATTESFDCDWEWNPWKHKYEYVCNERGDDYFVSGQEINPSEYGGSVEIVKLGVHPSCSHCYDPWGDRYFAVQNAVGSLDWDKGDHAGLIEFSTDLSGDANVYQDLTSTPGKINESLRINPGGGTDISEAVFEAQDHLNDEGSPDRPDFIILLTDGEHNGGYPSPDDPAVYNYVDDNTTLFAVGFGNADETELKTLANNTGTNESQFIPADNSSQIAEKFKQIVEDNITSQDRPKIKVTNVSPVGGSTVEEGEKLTVEVTVENVGSGTGKVPVMLRENFTTAGSSIPVNATSVNVAPGGTLTFNMSWDTTGAVDPGNDTKAPVVVESPENQDSTEVKIKNSQANFKVNDVVTNADLGDSSISSVEDLVVDINITNAGSKAEAQELVFKRNDTNLASPIPIRTNDTGTIPAGATAWINGTVLSPSEIVTNTTTIIVETEDNTVEKQKVNITADTGANVTVSIDPDKIPATDSAQAVDAGDTITIPVNVTNTGSNPISADELVISLYKQLNTGTNPPQTLANITLIEQPIGPGNSVIVDVEWDTTGSGWDDDPWVLTAEVENEAETVDVWVNEGEGPSLGGPGFGGGGSGITFSIEDIQVAD